MGVIPNTVLGLLEKRKDVACEIEKQALKIILATVYGLFGTEFYSFYRPICANAIVQYGRHACDIAEAQLTDPTLNICSKVL